MGPAVYIMAILGCGEAEAACEPVATVPAHYRSEEECNAAAEDEIARRDDILFPVVVAQCRPAAQKVVQKLFADEVSRPGYEDASKIRRAPIRTASLARS
jgi:hypothetical protein